MAFISLKEIVNDFLDDIGNTDGTLRRRATKLAVRGYREISLNTIPQIKSEVLTIEANNTVNLPDNLIALTKVGVCHNGRVCTLGVDDSLCLTVKEEDNCSCEEAEQEINKTLSCSCGCNGLAKTNFHCDCYCGGSYGYRYYNVWRRDCYIGELYGVGRGYNHLGLYRYDKKNCRLILSTKCGFPIGSEILVEYTCDATANDAQSVPVEIAETVMHFMKWRYYERINYTLSETKGNEFKRDCAYKLPKFIEDYSFDDFKKTLIKYDRYSVKGVGA